MTPHEMPGACAAAHALWGRITVGGTRLTLLRLRERGEWSPPWGRPLPDPVTVALHAAGRHLAALHGLARAGTARKRSRTFAGMAVRPDRLCSIRAPHAHVSAVTQAQK